MISHLQLTSREVKCLVLSFPSFIYPSTPPCMHCRKKYLHTTHILISLQARGKKPNKTDLISHALLRGATVLAAVRAPQSPSPITQPPSIFISHSNPLLYINPISISLPFSTSFAQPPEFFFLPSHRLRSIITHFVM